MEERIAIITGGTRGLGRAIACRLALGGTTPALFFRADDAAAATCLEEVRAIDPHTRTYRVDITDSDQVQRAVAQVLSDFGQIDVLVNNAFTLTKEAHKLHEFPTEAWATELATNITGPFLVTRECLPTMIARQHGRIVFMGSIAMRGEAGRCAYAAAKMAQLGLVRTLAREYAASGITANMVSPGYINAGTFRRLPEGVRQRALRSVPMKRAGSATEVAEAVWYFTTRESGYTTGQVLGVDGAAP